MASSTWFFQDLAPGTKFMAMTPGPGWVTVEDAVDGYLRVRNIDENDKNVYLVDAHMTVGWYIASNDNIAPAKGRSWSFFKAGKTISGVGLLDEHGNAWGGFSLSSIDQSNGWMECIADDNSRWLISEGALAGEYHKPAAWKVADTEA